jgi:hypothetical protein
MLTIVWDIDDVLNGLTRDWLVYAWKPQHPDCRHEYEDIIRHPPERILGISRREYLESLDEFSLSTQAWRMEPAQEVLHWFRMNGARFRHVALTSRPLESAARAAEWVTRYFGNYIRVIGMVPSRVRQDAPMEEQHPEDYVEWWSRGDILVDDNRSNIEAAGRIGVCGVLFPQPWNGNSCSGGLASGIDQASVKAGEIELV